MDLAYFDSSVFLAIFNNEKSAQDAGALLKELRQDHVRLYTSILTVEEVSVLTFCAGHHAGGENYAKVARLARVAGINKEMALLAAKYEAQLLGGATDARAKSRRRWDCFHLAVAVSLGCRFFYSLDEGQIAHAKRLELTGIEIGKPHPRRPSLFPDNVPGKRVE